MSLRGRLLAALLFVSAITLGVAAYALIDPLADRLRAENVSNLRTEALAARPEFQRALRGEGSDLRQESLDLQERASARVIVARPTDFGDFRADTDRGAPTRTAQKLVLRALRTRETVLEVSDDEATVAVRLFVGDQVLVAERQLTDVARTVDQVRNALLAAGAVGVLVAVFLALAISTALLRRLERLRATVRTIAEEGPDAPPPHDDVRDEVGDLARAFARMQEALRREEASRRSFVATASHELRTPLTMLQGTMELLEEDLRDGRVDLSDAQLQVASARRELRRLTSLAGELLDLSRLDAQVPLRSEPVELAEITRAVAAEFALQAVDREVAVVADIPDAGSWALADPDATARIVRILVDNAVRHAPAGTEVAVAVHPARIEVSDQGAGVLPQDRERIFERFYRAADASAESGFGLGLAIGRGLAEQMGGTLTLTSGDGEGGRFTLVLPSAPLDVDGRLDGVGPLREGRGRGDRGDREAGILR